jgi:hypothetical protein
LLHHASTASKAGFASVLIRGALPLRAPVAQLRRSLRLAAQKRLKSAIEDSFAHPALPAAILVAGKFLGKKPFAGFKCVVNFTSLVHTGLLKCGSGQIPLF